MNHELRVSKVTNEHSRERWSSLWSYYIKLSQRGSSSAIATAETFIRMANISPGSKVLDLGCGHGRITELLVQRIPSLEVVGVDMTRELLDNFVVQTGVNGCTITLKCGNIASLPLDDGYFDAVVSSRAFQYLPSPVVGVAEAFRVLRPGGALVIAVPNKLNPIKYVTYNQPLYSPFQVRDWFKASGFRDVVYRSMCFFPPSVRLMRLASFMEVGERVPLIKYFGGNALVKGVKSGQ